MNIPVELLKESNYTGTRLIEVDDPKLRELNEVIKGYQQEINPVLDKLTAEYYPVIDPMYQEVQRLQAQIKEIKEKIAEQTLKFKEDIEIIESTEQKAMAIKNKMQPIILKALEGQLGEFEIAKNTVTQDGKVFAEVYDELEEKIKAVRASKAKNNGSDH